jgi:hypothetical protein
MLCAAAHTLGVSNRLKLHGQHLLPELCVRLHQRISVQLGTHRADLSLRLVDDFAASVFIGSFAECVRTLAA